MRRLVSRTQPESFLTSKKNGENNPEVLLQVRFLVSFFVEGLFGLFDLYSFGASSQGLLLCSHVVVT